MAVMMTPREKWTDERLDDLNKKVDEGFTRMDTRFDRIEARSDERFKEVNRRFDEVNARLGRLEDGFFALNRTLWGGGFVIVAAIIGSSAL